MGRVWNSAIALAAALLVSQSALGQVIFSDNFDGGPNPNGTATFPGFGVWYLPTSPADDAESDAFSCNTITPPAALGTSEALRISYAFDSAEVRIGLSDTWDSNFDYTLAFDVGAENRRAQDYTAGVRVNARGASGGVVTPATDIATGYTSSILDQYVRAEVVIRGRDIARAGADGENIYLEIFHLGGPNGTDVAWIDNLELSRAAAAPVPPTGNYRFLLSEAGDPAVNEFQIVNGDWSFVRTIVAGPAELVPGAGPFDAPRGVAYNPATNLYYIASASAFSFLYEVDENGVPTTNGPLSDGILADSIFDFSGTIDALFLGSNNRLFFTLTDAGGSLNGVWVLNLNTYAPPTQLISNSGAGYTLSGVRDLTIAGDGNLYVANRGLFDDVLTGGEDQVLRFDPNSGAFIDVFYDLENRPSGLDWDAANSRLLVACDDATLAFTDLNNSAIVSVVAESTFANNPTDVISVDGTPYIVDEVGAERVLRPGVGQNVIYAVSGQLDNPTYLVNLGTFEVGQWDGGGADDNFSTAQNWAGDNAPDFSEGVQASLVFTGSTRVTPNNDIPNGFVSSLAFDPNADSFGIFGNSFTLTGTAENLSMNPQTIHNDIVSQVARFETADATGDPNADLTLTGTLTTLDPNDEVILTGDGDHLLTGPLAGPGQVSKFGPGTLTLASASPGYTGLFTVGGGQTLVLDPNAFGDAATETEIGQGENVRLELGGNIELAEPLTLVSRVNNGAEYRMIESVDGINTISGPLTLQDSGVGADNYSFAATAGQALVITGALTPTVDPETYILRTTAGGAGFAGGSVEWATPIFGSPTIETRVASNDGTTILSAASNAVNGRVGAFGSSGEVQLINGTTTNNIPDCPQISAAGVNTVVDFSGLSGGGIVMSANNLLLDGQGTFRGNVVANAATTIVPDEDDGTLTFEGGLDLSNGPTLEMNIGDPGDRLRVTAGSLVGPSSGTVSLKLIPAVPFVSDTFTLIEFDGATPVDLDPGDFTIDTSMALGLISSANVIITATEVQVSVTANPSPISDVLVVSGSGDRVDLYKVQVGVWAYQGPFIEGPIGGEGFNPFSVVQDALGDLYVCERDTSSAGRLLKFDRSGFFLEELGRNGVEYIGGPEYMDVDLATGDLYMTIAQPPRNVVKYDAGTGSFVDPFIPEDGTGYATGRMRGIAVAPGGRLFASDIEDNQVLEFDLATGAFNAVIDTPTNPHPTHWDPIGNRLITNGSFPVQAQEYVGGVAPANALLNSSTGFGIHDFTTIGGTVYAASFAQNAVIAVTGPTTAGFVAFATPGPVALQLVSVSTAGRYDLDLDDDVDFDDVAIVLDCMSGPDNTTVPPGCTPVQFAKSDAESDGDVDMADILELMKDGSVGQ